MKTHRDCSETYNDRTIEGEIIYLFVPYSEMYSSSIIGNTRVYYLVTKICKIEKKIVIPKYFCGVRHPRFAFDLE